MITGVVGGQFGSEGKGLIVGHVARAHDVHVRVGAANAGHTVYTLQPIENSAFAEKHVMQQLPCAAYANPDALLVLGAGAMISPDILRQEIDRNVKWREEYGLPQLKLWIDTNAHVVTPLHIETEQKTALVERIGSTSGLAGKGIGAAQAARTFRVGYTQVTECDDWDWIGAYATDTVRGLHELLDDQASILLEGTQGTSLSNTTGFYPYVTSRDVTMPAMLAQTGLPHTAVRHTILVCRTFPIRVAGNSGPFWPDSEEIRWSDIGVPEDKERTTVTKKIRRVATFSTDQVKHSVLLNGATEIALTFCDYLDRDIAGHSGRYYGVYDHKGLMQFVWSLADETGIPVRMLGTGPSSVIDV